MTGPSSSLPTPESAWTWLHSFGHTVIARNDKVPCHPEPPYDALLEWQVKKNPAPLAILLGWGRLRGIVPGTYGLVVVNVDQGDPADLIAIAPPMLVLESGTPGHYHLVYRGTRDFTVYNWEAMGCSGQVIHNHFAVLYGDNAQRLLQAIFSSRTANPFPDDIYARVAGVQPAAVAIQPSDDDLLDHLDLPLVTGAHLRYHHREDGLFHIARPHGYDYIRAHYQPDDPDSFSMSRFYAYMVGILSLIHSSIPYSEEAVKGCGEGCDRCANRKRRDLAILPRRTIASTARSIVKWCWALRDELVGHITYHRPPTFAEQSRRGKKSVKARRTATRDRDARIVHAASKGQTYRAIATTERVHPSTVCRVVGRVKLAVREDMQRHQLPLGQPADAMVRASWVRIYKRLDLQPETDPAGFYRRYLPRQRPNLAPPDPPLQILPLMWLTIRQDYDPPTPLIWFPQ